GEREMLCESVHAVTDFGGRVRNAFGPQPLVDRLPGRAAVIGPERSGGRDGDEPPLRVGRIEQDRVEAESACARLPAVAGLMLAESRQFLPVLPAIARLEERRVLDAGIDRV